MDEPRLREIRLDADDLVVDIVVVGGISADHLERVERKTVPAVVVDSLAGREGEEEGGLSDGEARDGLGEHGAERVEQEALEGVVVERTKGVRDVEPVVYRVDVLVEELVYVHRAMEEVLPGVEDDPGMGGQQRVRIPISRGEHVHGNEDLHDRDDIPIEEINQPRRRVIEEAKEGVRLLVQGGGEEPA